MPPHATSRCLHPHVVALGRRVECTSCVEWFEEGDESDVEAGGSQSADGTEDMCAEYAGGE